MSIRMEFFLHVYRLKMVSSSEGGHMPEEPGTISITGRWQGHRGSGLLLDEAQEGSGRQGQCWVECCEDTEAFSDGVS